MNEEKEFYLCKKKLVMDNEKKEVAFKKGKAYPVVYKYDNGTIELIDEQGDIHEMGVEFTKKHLVKIKDKRILKALNS